MNLMLILHLESSFVFLNGWDEMYCFAFHLHDWKLRLQYAAGFLGVDFACFLCDHIRIDFGKAMNSMRGGLKQPSGRSFAQQHRYVKIEEAYPWTKNSLNLKMSPFVLALIQFLLPPPPRHHLHHRRLPHHRHLHHRLLKK